ncbi:phospholipid transport system transporter-binding protein [Enterobacter sp. BIGb0383]|uniref:lipid asymmetry maintenance protein MlaB n=1 Tax=unclassified Enterobacter TaxID=2608935 RepID=UPI000F461FB1|nr:MULTISPECIES: lipid asymmetry maintenance protein MlaB [unclassified Enterobacter]ROP58060.1 phospholipid transport system transporter-binding protein [Enterobacter sp. BIGb0383]ROS00873.1 phospholipid transport system transporter-binding protein [Enterobacter sp. BIGb0359]
MPMQLNWTRDGERLALQGELDQDTLNGLWDVREQAIQGVSVIDLSEVSRVDTAGLALLIHLADRAKQLGQTVRLESASENLRTLAQLYNLPDGLLPGAN